MPLLLPAVLGRQHGPLEFRQRRALVLRPHIDPDPAAPLGGRIGLHPHLAPVVGLGRLVRHLHAIAVHIELPAVIDAAQAAVLIAAEIERGAPVGAFLVENADPAARVPEGHEVLAQQPEPHRVAIGPRQLLRHERRKPEPAEQRAHRRAGTGPAEQFVVFRFQHCGTPRSGPVSGGACRRPARPSSMAGGLSRARRCEAPK